MSSPAGKPSAATLPEHRLPGSTHTARRSPSRNNIPADRVRVNALSPGMVKTDLNQFAWKAGQANLPPSERQDYEARAAEKIRKVSPLGRWQTPAEFAAMAVFLASDHAANITGQTINIDGGQVMHS